MLLVERYFCLGLTAKPGTFSPVCGFRTKMTSSLIFLPTNRFSSSPYSFMSIFMLVLFTAHADFS